MFGPKETESRPSLTCMETLIANHKVQHTSFSKVKENEAQISLIQKQISEKMVQIEFFQSKFYNSLKSVEAIIKTGKDIIYCTDIAADIGKYQKQMVELAVGDPALLLVSAKTELELVNRTADLTQYIYQVAIVGTRTSGSESFLCSPSRSSTWPPMSILLPPVAASSAT